MPEFVIAAIAVAAIAIAVTRVVRGRTPVDESTPQARAARRDAARGRHTAQVEAERMRGRHSPWW